MKMRFLFLVAMAVVVAFAGPVQAGLANPGFETGDLTGWSPFGTAAVVNSHDVLDLSTPPNVIDTYDPKEGSYFAKLEANPNAALATISQTVTLSAGDILSGWFALDFLANIRAGLPANAAKAYINVFDDTLTLKYEKEIFGDPSYSPWVYWEWQAVAGQYTVEFGANDILGVDQPFFALFDTIGTSPPPGPIPEPATLFLLGAGLIGLAGAGRKHLIARR